MTPLEFEQLKAEFNMWHRHCPAACLERFCFAIWWREEGEWQDEVNKSATERLLRGIV